MPFFQEPKSETKTVREGPLVRLVHPVPTLTGDKSLWINADKPVTFEAGKVYVVHFWTFGCINCKRNLPIYARWEKRFAREIAAGDLNFASVHTPETDEEKEFKNVEREIKRWGIRYPTVFDPKSENWNRWQQQYWPTVYLIDRRQKVRYYWKGELEWQSAGGDAKMARFIEELLREK